MSATASSYFGGVGNFTNPYSYNTTDMMTIGDEWVRLAQQFLRDGNGTAAIDTFCDVWVNGIASVDIPATTTSATLTTDMWNHAMTKTIGWTMVMLLKSVLLERKLDNWSGSSRFLNVGTTILPFGMALWSIVTAMVEEGWGDSPEAQEPLSTTALTTILWNHVVNTPAVRNWVLTGLAWTIFYHLVLGKIKSTKMYSTIAWIPGILAGSISLACWAVDETTIAAILLGGGGRGGKMLPNTLKVYATIVHWTANAIAGWYCYAWIIRTIFRTNLFTSFSSFLFVIAAGATARASGVLPVA